MSKGVTLRQSHCRHLAHFDNAANAAHFVGRMAKGMVSSFFSPADEGETTARNSPWSDVAGCSAHVMAQSRGGVRVDRKFSCGSPVAASRSFRPCLARLPP